MARVPAWTELRLDAIKLTKLQDECYNSIHYLLDVTLPELDKKIQLLSNHNSILSRKLSPEAPPQPCNNLTEERTLLQQQSSPITLETFNYTTSAFNSISEFDIRMHEPVQYHSTVIDIPYIKRRERCSPEDLSSTKKSPEHQIVKSKTVDSNLHQYNSVITNGFNNKSPVKRKEYNLNDYEHLKPLPMPLSAYLKTNRPEVVERADERAFYLRKKVERRKSLASSKIVSYLEQVRLSAKNSNFNSMNSVNKFKQHPRQARDQAMPDYQVRFKLSEHEMKKLTARNYRKLPEVERRRREEDTKYMKVQNYKNKIEYGRKLLQNRRLGIINYPLKASYDEGSISSSRDDYLTNNDSLRSDDVSFRIESCY